MGKKEEVFSLYNKLNILLTEEQRALSEGDIEKAFDFLEEESKVIAKINDYLIDEYIVNGKDKENFSKIISLCMKKRAENEKLLLNLKESLKERILELEKRKRGIKSYYKKETGSSKFIDKIK